MSILGFFLPGRQAKIAGAVLSVALPLAGGAALAEGHEHLAPWGLAARVRALASAIDGPSGLKARLKVMTGDRDAWRRADQDCEAQRRVESGRAAGGVTAASETKARASSDAFDQGYAAGRVAGRKTCGGSNATTSPDTGRSSADGLRDDGPDFADAWRRGADAARGDLSPRN